MGTRRITLLLTLLLPATATAELGTKRAPIVSGQPATTAQLHSTVALVDPSTGDPFCTGTLISPRLVVTAGHCFVIQDEQTGAITGWYDQSGVAVVAGVLEALQASDAQWYDVERVVIHDKYRNQELAPADDETGIGNWSDIALLVLTEAVDNLPTTPVLPSAQVDSTLTQGTSIIITGYGINDLQTEAAGVLYIAQTPFQRHNGWEYIAGAEGNPDSCQGDSGGPGYVVAGGTRYLIGVSSRATDDAIELCGEGGINTLVPSHLDWIKQQAGDAYVEGGGTTGGGTTGGGTGGGNSLGCTAVADSPSAAGMAVALVLVGLALLGIRRRRSF